MATAKQTPPKQPTEVFDLDAFQAEADDTEAKGDFVFRFGGENYTLPAKPDIFALMDVDNGRLETGMRKLLKGDQWARMQASDAVMDVDRLIGLLKAYGKHIGRDLGESSASRVSSPSTARRSKRTSNGSTTFR